jgi:hypothetical protein
MLDHLPNGEQAVEHDTQEHKQLETLMKQMEAADAEGAEFLEVLGAIRQVLFDRPLSRRRKRQAWWVDAQ